MTRPLRVGIVGNVAGVGHRLGEVLRHDPAFDPSLYVDRAAAATSRTHGAEDWVHEGRWITPATVLAPWRAPLTRALAGCDVVVAMGPGPIFAQHAGVPWCWYVTGGDLTVKPFPIEFRSWYPDRRHQIGELVAGAWQRRAARRADRLWLQPFAPMVDAADRLGVAADRRSDRYIPIPLDPAGFPPEGQGGDPDLDDVVGADAAARIDAADLVVFHPTRLVLDDLPRLVRTGQWKGNGTLLQGLAEVVRRGRVGRPLLVLPDTPLSRDRDRVRTIVRDLGLEDRVAWVVPADGHAFAPAEMRTLYRAADVVCDEFGVGWFGYVALEGAATGRPVVTHVDEAVMASLYPDGHPFLDASTPAGVADRLEALHGDPSLRARAGAEGRAWVERHHGPEGVRAVAAAAIGELAADVVSV